MVVPVIDATGQQVAIHRTWLQPDGSGKADVTTPKKMQGKFSAGAIYIGKCNGPSVGIGEGIETCMAVYEDTGIPMIAAGSATHIAKVTLPREATNILIFADADEAGRKGAESAAKRFCSEGKPVCILTPQTDSDWLDVLNEQGPDSIVKAVEIAEPWIATIDQRSNTSAANGQQGGRQPFDIAAVADEYADSRRDSKSRILTRYYRQQWFVYDEIYHPAQFDDVKGSVMSWLRQHYPERANRNCQSNIVENLKATNLAGIESNASFPSWLSDGSDAGDMLVLQNCAVNIPALARNEPGAVSDPTPDLFTTNVADYRYDPTATCPRWQSFITDVQPSIKGQETLQMLAGLLLILDTSYNVFFILQGIPGSGKSVFLHVLRHLVGEQNVCCVPLTKFTDRFTSWMLADYRLNIVGDMPTVSDYGRSLHEIEGMLKDATDGGLIPYEHKHRDPQNDRTAIARNVFSTNSLPHFFDRSNGIWDRLRIIPFEQRFRGTENENPQLRHELLDELPGIFNWAVEGLWQLQQHRQFPEHPDGLSTKDAHRNSCDPERLFLEEEYRKGLDDDWEKAGDVYAAYTNWCESNGRRGKQSEANFAASVQRIFGITKERSRFRGERLRVYKGLRTND